MLKAIVYLIVLIGIVEQSQQHAIILQLHGNSNSMLAYTLHVKLGSNKQIIKLRVDTGSG